MNAPRVEHYETKATFRYAAECERMARLARGVKQAYGKNPIIAPTMKAEDNTKAAIQKAASLARARMLTLYRPPPTGGTTMTRKVYHSVPTGGGWAVKSGGKTISNHHTQAASEQAAIKAGHRAENKGGLGQAVLHKANGIVREERTYGEDPPHRKG